MKLDMKYVSTYTVPAGEDSISSFKNYKCYFFSDIGDGKFNTDEIKKSDYLGLGTPYKIDDGNYVKIKYVGDIKDINKFDIDYDDTIITFKDLELSSEVKRAFKVHIDAFHRYSNGNIGADTPLSWNYILVNNPIKVEENILYPLREVVPFALNVDKENKYIKLNNFLNTIIISDNISLNTKNKYLIIDGEDVKIPGSNAPLYSLILEKLYSSDERIFSFDEEVEDFKKIKKDLKTDYEYLNGNIVRGFNKNFGDLLPFKLSFSKNQGDYHKAFFIK